MNNHNLRVLFLILVIALILVMLSGCANKEIVVPSSTPVVCLNPPEADPLVMRDVEFYYIEGGHITMTAKSYENMADNLQDILAHIKQKNAIIRYYESCIEALNQYRNDSVK